MILIQNISLSFDFHIFLTSLACSYILICYDYGFVEAFLTTSAFDLTHCKTCFAWTGKTDPYVVLSLGDQAIRSKKNSQTTVIGPPGEPIWNQVNDGYFSTDSFY